MFPITLPTKTTQETAMPGPLGASNRYRTAVREQFEALHKPSPDVVQAQPDSDPFRVDTKPVSQAPAQGLAAPAPVSRSKEWSDPEKKAERARRRAEWASARIKQGQDEEETRRRATEAAYREAIKSA